MDIFNRPPGISKDTLQYSIYPHLDATDKLSVTTVTGLAAAIEAFVKELLPADFLWHRDAFELKVAQRDFNSTKGKEDGWMLEGRMRVGDSVDDEWYVVWLMREVSKKCDVAATVYDQDGEFMLIEAAEYLPSWVTPENSENRIWLFRGNLHIIPLSHNSAPSTKPKQRRKLGGHEGEESEDFVNCDGEDGWLNVQDALNALRSNAPTEAPKEVQDAVWKRIAGYPAAARHHIHVTKAFIPIDIAKVLSRERSLVQRAVETFYTRDAMQLRAAHKMSRFPPQSSVLTPVRMTRTAYAQLVGQKFHPPNIFGQFKEREGTREWKWRDIGMKIACGFEMLYQESKARSESLSPEALKGSTEARKDALRRNLEYTEYTKKLKSMGYFRDEIEGSRLWNELEDRAADIFINSRRGDDATRPSFATLVNIAIAQAGENPMLPNLEEESDEWLNIDAENFDTKLEETLRPRRKPPTDNKESMDVDRLSSIEDQEGRLAQVQADMLKGLAKRIENFVEGEGALEGAVFEDEKMSEDEQLSELSEEESSSDEDARIKQVDDETTAAERAARQEAMDKLVPALDASEYGKMPPEFYNNSQKVAPVTMETEWREDVSDQSACTISAATGGATAIINQAKASANESARRSRPIRRPILPRDNFDGVDSDDESDEAEEEEEEECPQVVGEVEIDMGEEQEEFLEFSRTALGISDEMWNEILQERRNRGVYAPKGIYVRQNQSKEQNVSTQTTSQQSSGQSLWRGQSDPRPNPNPNLDSFEAVMEAMEAELAKAKLAKKGGALSKLTPGDNAESLSTAEHKGKEKATDTDIKMGGEDEDIEAAMDAELHAALEKGEGDSGDEEPMDYGMIKNFLESFKSQAGLAGPVSTLAGRLEPGWLPRDES